MRDVKRDEPASIPGRPTRLVLIQPNGSQLSITNRVNEAQGFIDLAGLHNANAAAPLLIEVQQQCEMGSWHAVGRCELPCWAG